MVGIIGGLGERSFRDRSVGKAIETFVRVIGVGGSEPIELIFWREEVSIFHPQWLEDSGAEKFVQGLAGDEFDKTPENVHSQAVLPLIAGAKEERYSCKMLHAVR